MLYLDTSALLKAYIAEADSAVVIGAIHTAVLVATTRIAYAEARSAFARALRERRITVSDLSTLVHRLDADWSTYFVVEMDARLIHSAGQLVDRHTGHALRALDAIHLASALTIAGGDLSKVTFGCWDRRLWRAARDDGFVMLHAAGSGAYLTDRQRRPSGGTA